MSVGSIIQPIFFSSPISVSIMAGTFRQVAKATFLVSKKDGLSDEEFRKYYTEVHAPMALDLCKRYGVLDYSIVSLGLISL